MLRIVTRSSLYSVPLTQVQDRLTWGLINMLTQGIVSDMFAREVLAHARGETTYTNIEYLTGPVQVREVTIDCNDGNTVMCNKETLIRNFQFFDQYFTIHPTANSVYIDVPSVAVKAALEVYYTAPLLTTAHPAIVLFNPKNHLFFLDFDPSNCSKEVLLYYIDNMNDEDKKLLVEINQNIGVNNSVLNPPDCAYRPLLARLSYLHALYNTGLLDDVCKKHPTYNLWLRIMYGTGVNVEDIDIDYSQDTSDYSNNRSVLFGLAIVLRNLIPTLDKTRLCRLMAMCGARNSYFNNMNDKSIMPGGFVMTDTAIRVMLRDKQEDISRIMGFLLVLFAPVAQQVSFHQGEKVLFDVDALHDI